MIYNYNHLYYFYITAKSESVTSAARHLSISQPALTSQLKILEAQLGIKLFKKVGRINKLTENGSLVLGYCRRMFEISEELSDVVLDGLPAVTRRLHVGVSHDIERSFIGETVSCFLAKQDMESRPLISIVSGTHEKLVEKLKFREIDLIVVDTPVSEAGLKGLARAESPVLLTCSVGSKKLAGETKARRSATHTAQMLKDSNSNWSLPSRRFRLRSEIEHFFEENNITAKVVFESDVLSSLVRSVVDGLGCAFVLLIYLEEELEKKSIRILGSKEGCWSYRLWLLCDESGEDDPLVTLFRDSFVESAKSRSKICSQS